MKEWAKEEREVMGGRKNGEEWDEEGRKGRGREEDQNGELIVILLLTPP